MQVNVSEPSTVYISFVQETPRYFCLYDMNDELYYFRFLNGSVKGMKFNVPDAGGYYTNVDVTLDRINGIETPASYPILPPAERNRFKDLTLIYDPSLTGTPCCIDSQSGIVEYNDEFLSYTKAMQEFLILHEQGHLLYKTEEYCDLWALVNFLRKGYNRSTAYYCLYYILGQSAGQVNRLSYLLFNIRNCEGEFSSGL